MTGRLMKQGRTRNLGETFVQRVEIRKEIGDRQIDHLDPGFCHGNRRKVMGPKGATLTIGGA